MSKEAFAQIMANSGAEPPVQEAPVRSVEAPEPAGPKIGEGHAMAMLRLGGHEITQALQAFPDSNIRPMEEPGVFGNENAPQRVLPKESGDQSVSYEAPKEVSLKDILDAPTPPPTPQVERDNGREM